MLPDGVIQTYKPAIPLSRVELHVHLDGSVRTETAWEITKVKGLKLPGEGTLQDFQNAIAITEPKDLQRFLKSFTVFTPAFLGDLKAIKRIAIEFAEDVARNGGLYVEARFCPHLLMDEKKKEVTSDSIVDAVIEGFQEGEKRYGVKIRLILCCINGLFQYSHDILRLCKKYLNEGVVGIDIAGNEGAIAHEGGAEMYTAEEKAIFVEAKNHGIHRTVHAGEMGPPANVLVAIDEMYAERIGHGYRIMQDPVAYERCLKEKIHFEACPTSSILTGSVSITDASLFRHPILNFAKDGANFSVNTDDPTVTGTWLNDEFTLLQSWGLTESTLTRATFNAARSCFLPDEDKKDLLRQLRVVHGIDADEEPTAEAEQSTSGNKVEG